MNPRTLPELQDAIIGDWTSISVELRPTEDRTDSGVVTPTFLRRHFTYRPDGTFTGIIRMFADDYGALPMMEFEFSGHLVWHDPHPIAEGAFSVDYVLDVDFAVTPLAEPAVEMLNSGLVDGMAPFEFGVRTSIFGKAFPMFNIAEGQIVGDYDLLYLRDGMLFMGAKHVDGTPFDRPERRPHQLQIPLVRA